jgi:hypothetical protein
VETWVLWGFGNGEALMVLRETDACLRAGLVGYREDCKAMRRA